MCSDKIFGKTFVSEKTIADFIKLKTFLEGNILGVKLMTLDLKKTKIIFFCQFTFKGIYVKLIKYSSVFHPSLLEMCPIMLHQRI